MGLTSTMICLPSENGADSARANTTIPFVSVPTGHVGTPGSDKIPQTTPRKINYTLSNYCDT